MDCASSAWNPSPHQIRNCNRLSRYRLSRNSPGRPDAPGNNRRTSRGGVSDVPAGGSGAMSLKDILVCLDATGSAEARLRLAAGLASEQHAHLSAACILPEQTADPGIAEHDGLGFHAPKEAAAVAEGSLVAGIPAPAAPPAAKGDYARRLELADLMQQRFREALQLDGIAGGDWQLFGEGESENLLAAARAADLVIYPQG